MTIMPMIVVEMVAASFEKFGSSSVIKIVCFSPCGFHAGTASMPPVMPSAELTAVEIAAACASLSADAPAFVPGALGPEATSVDRSKFEMNYWDVACRVPRLLSRKCKCIYTPFLASVSVF